MAISYPTYTELCVTYINHMLSSYSNCEENESSAYIDYNSQSNVYSNKYENTLFNNHISRVTIRTNTEDSTNIEDFKNNFISEVSCFSKNDVEGYLSSFIKDKCDKMNIETNNSIVDLSDLLKFLSILSLCSNVYFRQIKSVIYNKNENSKNLMPIIFYNPTSTEVEYNDFLTKFNELNSDIIKDDTINIVDIITPLFTKLKILYRNYKVSASTSGK